jgi:hypothetical protein
MAGHVNVGQKSTWDAMIVVVPLYNQRKVWHLFSQLYFYIHGKN